MPKDRGTVSRLFFVQEIVETRMNAKKEQKHYLQFP